MKNFQMEKPVIRGPELLSGSQRSNKVSEKAWKKKKKNSAKETEDVEKALLWLLE